MSVVDLSALPAVEFAVASLRAGDGESFDAAMDTLRDLPGPGPWESAAAVTVLAASFCLAAVSSDGDGDALAWSRGTFVAVDARTVDAVLRGLRTGDLSGVRSMEELVLNTVLLLGWLHDVSPVSPQALQEAVGADVHVISRP